MNHGTSDAPQHSPPRKIAHVITRLIVGGAQENTVATVLGLQEDPSWQVTMVSGEETGPEGRLDLSGVHNLVFFASLVRRVHPLKDLLALWSLWRLFRRERFAVVHTHSSKAGILGRLAARLAGVPRIVHTIHGLPFHPFQGALRNHIFIIMERLAARWCHRIIVVADQMRVQALAAGIGRPSQYVTVFSGMRLDAYLAAPVQREDCRRDLGFLPGQMVIGKVARFFPLKGHDYFFAAARALIRDIEGVRFLLVGDGVLLPGFRESLARENLLEYFVFTGLQPPESIPRLLAAMDILVHVSLREGLARVLPQAMAARVPPVAFDIDGARDLIIPEHNGCLVAAGDAGGLVQTLKRLCLDAPLRRALGMRGPDAVNPRFRDEIMVRELQLLYTAPLCSGAD